LNQLVFKLSDPNTEIECSFSDVKDKYDLNSFFEEIKLLGLNEEEQTLFLLVNDAFKYLTESEMVFVLNEALPYEAKLHNWAIIRMKLQKVELIREI